MKIPISALLREKLFDDFQLLSGEENLEQAITATACLDCPDGLNYLHGGEFILTSGYILKDDPSLSRKVVEDCHSRNIALLGIDKDFFRQSASRDMLKRAKELGVPVLAIPQTFSFEMIHRFFSDNFYSPVQRKVKKKYEVIMEFNDALEREGFSGILKLLYEWTGYRACICSDTGATNYSYPNGGLAGLQPVSPQGHMKRKTLFNILPGENGGVGVLGSKLVHGGREDDLICLFSENGDPFSADDEELICVAGGMCVNELKRNSDILSLKHDQVHNLVQDIISGNCTEKEAENLARSYGYHLQGEYRLAVLRADAPLEPEAFPVLWRHLFRQGILAVIRGPKTSLLLMPEDWSRFDERQLYEDIGRIIKRKDYTMVFSPKVCYEELPATYRDAKHAIKIGNILLPQKRMLHFDDLEAYLLFDYEANADQYLNLIHRYIHPLLEDREQELLSTARAFVECGYNYTKTAEQLFLHSNTIRYRVARIQKLLGVDFKNQRQRYLLETTLLLYGIKDCFSGKR